MKRGRQKRQSRESLKDPEQRGGEGPVSTAVEEDAVEGTLTFFQKSLNAVPVHTEHFSV